MFDISTLSLPKSILLGVVCFYLTIMLVLYVVQRRLIYLPALTPAYTKDVGLRNVRIRRVQTEDGLGIILWHVRTHESMPTIIYYHGNAGTLGDRADKYRSLSDAGFNVIALSYRGYSGNPGRPSEAGLYMDARAALAYAYESGVMDEQIILYGESLGSGVAVQMATEMDPRMLVLEAPYTAVSDRAAEIYPWLPIKLLIKDKYRSIDKIANIHTPLLIFHGDQDKTIPIAHGRKLLELAPDPKRGIFFEGIGHTDFDFNRQAAEVKRFYWETEPEPEGVEVISSS